MPLDSPILLFVFPRQDVLDALFEFENRFLVSRINVEAPFTFFLEVKVSLCCVTAARDHDESESEEGSFGVTVGTVKEDSTGKSVRVIRRTSLVSDPESEVDSLVDEGGTSSVGTSESHRTRERFEVNDVFDLRTEDSSFRFEYFLASKETVNIFVSLALFL
jgi:hypothetical protein